MPRSPLRRQSSWSSRASSEVLSYVEAAPQLEDLREEAAESALHPDLVHLENLGSTEANAGPNLLVSSHTHFPPLLDGCAGSLQSVRLQWSLQTIIPCCPRLGRYHNLVLY